jgi:hypothetical protein
MMVKQRIIELSQAHRRYGYGRIGALLRREGQRVNSESVQRIRRQQGLQVRKQQRATRRVGISSALRQRAQRANHLWSWDIIHDQTQAGSSLCILTLIDEYTKQCLAIGRASVNVSSNANDLAGGISSAPTNPTNVYKPIRS